MIRGESYSGADGLWRPLSLIQHRHPRILERYRRARGTAESEVGRTDSEHGPEAAGATCTVHNRRAGRSIELLPPPAMRMKQQQEGAAAVEVEVEVEVEAETAEGILGKDNSRY